VSGWWEKPPWRVCGVWHAVKVSQFRAAATVMSLTRYGSEFTRVGPRMSLTGSDWSIMAGAILASLTTSVSPKSGRGDIIDGQGVGRLHP
jgi:hypothetical protein